MTDPTEQIPSLDDVEAAAAERRREAEVTDKRAELNTDEVRDLLDARDGRARFLATLSFVMSALFVLIVFALLWDFSGRYQQDQDETDAAIDSIRRSNSVLESRGQPTVPIPSDADPAVAVDAALVAQVLTRIPPAPTAEQVAAVVGPTALARITGPTADQLGQQVANYFTANAAALRGLRGEKGDGPTAQQIRAAVDAELAANPPPPGRDGRNGDRGEKGDQGVAGPPGVSFDGQEFVRDDTGACVSRVRDSTGAVTTRPAGDAACAPAPTTETPPTTEEGGPPTP